MQRLAGQRPSAEDERLVALFRNRAELKKELSALDDERHRLLDRLKLQEGATMRVEEQFAALEQYLGRAEEGYKCLAYFQLKSLWRAAAKRLQQFAAELARQQKDRERRQQLAEFDRAEAGANRGRRSGTRRGKGPGGPVAGRAEARASSASASSAASGTISGAASSRRRSRRGPCDSRRRRPWSPTWATRGTKSIRRPPPPFEGLSLEGRRAVNLAIIACAESLCDRLAERRPRRPRAADDAAAGLRVRLRQPATSALR